MRVVPRYRHSSAYGDRFQLLLQKIEMSIEMKDLDRRITVGLVSRAATDLEKTHERTRLTRTDIVNRAISLYEFLDAEMESGSELTLCRQDGTRQLVKLL